jgi:hypothetical protein
MRRPPTDIVVPLVLIVDDVEDDRTKTVYVATSLRELPRDEAPRVSH